MDFRSFSIGLLALSLICFSGSIVYFTVNIRDISREVPDIVRSIESTAEKFDKSITDAGHALEFVHPITNEVAAVRKQVPLIMKEVAEVRMQIPSILEEAKAVRQQIPSILGEVKGVRQQIPVIIEEVEKIRPLVPLVLDEVRKTREAIPTMLSETDKIITNAKQFGKTTTEGAVTGVITGIIKSPFEISGSLGKAIFGDLRENADDLTEKDMELIKVAVYQTLHSGQLGITHKWANAQSGNDGTVMLKKFVEIDSRDCRILSFQITTDNEVRINRDVTFCLNEHSEWKAMDQ